MQFNFVRKIQFEQKNRRTRVAKFGKNSEMDVKKLEFVLIYFLLFMIASHSRTTISGIKWRFNEAENKLKT